MRYAHLVIASLCWFAFSPPIATADNQSPRVEGIYFLPDNTGYTRLLRIQKGRFDVRQLGNLGGTVSGYFSGGQGGVHFIYFNGEKQIRCVCTSAVIEGRLWVGVFVRDRYDKQLFTCRTLRTGLFGPAQVGMPAGTIRWHFGESTWSLTPPHDNFNKSTVIKTRRVVHHPDDEDDRRLMPVFDQADHKTMATVFRDDGPRSYRDWAGWWAIGAGLFVDDKWNLDQKLKDAGDDAAARRKAIDDALHVNIGRRTFEQHGDVILTPWSLDLGPIGMAPASVKNDELVGEYVALHDDKVRITVKKSKQKKEDLLPHLEHLAFGQRTPAQWRTLLTTLEVEPDDWGLHRRVLYVNCMMGHADFPGYDLWLPLSGNRIARYVVPCTHLSNKSGWPLNDVVIMKKVGK